MKLLKITRIILAVILVCVAVPVWVLTLCTGTVNFADVLFFWQPLILLTVYFALFLYEGRLRKRRGVASFFDKRSTRALDLLQWICLAVILLCAFWLYLGADALHVGDFVEQEIAGLYITESDAEGFFFYGLFAVYIASALLSVSIPLFVGAACQISKRKRVLREDGAPT